MYLQLLGILLVLYDSHIEFSKTWQNLGAQEMLALLLCYYSIYQES